jgi:tellurite resistance protein
MEGIIFFIVMAVGWAIVQMAFSAGVKTVGAAGKAVTGKGSFSENMDLAFKGMGDFELRFIETRLNDDETGPIVKQIEGKGLFSLTSITNVGFVTSVFDSTNDELQPVFSAIEGFQEEESVVYQHVCSVGEIGPDQGFAQWVRIGIVIPDILEPPSGGLRKLKAIVRMVNLDDIPNIRHGYHDKGDSGVLWQRSLDFYHEFEGKGYEEASIHRDEAVALSLKIGMAVAMADGSLDDEEGNVLKAWIVKSIEPFSDQKKDHLKKLYNEAMRDSYALALKGTLSLSDLTERMNDIGEKTSKYETIELCFEVMAADGVADEAEINTIRQVAIALNLDMDEVAKIRDQKIIGLDSSVGDHASIETMLGIEPDWPVDQTMKHLRTEFQKWNNRLNTLEEGEERENAQKMLDSIAEARKKYVA